LLGDPRESGSLSAWFRRRRAGQLRALIEACAAEQHGVSIIDLGGTPNYWERIGSDFLRTRRVKVTVVNLHESELALAPELAELVTCEVGDACNLSRFDDRQFQLAHPNSVIEHVETWSNMKSFAAETRRVARAYYVQTPYFWFPVDPHYYRFPFFHWLPRPTRARLLNALPLTYSGRIQGVDHAFEIVDAARLLDRRQFEFLFPDSRITFERVAGLPKSMIAIRSA